MSNGMEIRVEPIQTPAIAWNYDQVREMISQITRRYTGMIYTDDDIKVAKEDRAELRKLKKALNDERLKQEREYMAPFQTFKKQVKELTEMIDEPVEMIDSQVKDYEERQREEKRKEVAAAIQEEDLEQYAGLVMQDKWLRPGFSMKRVRGELKTAKAKIEGDIGLINMQLEPVWAAIAQSVYEKTLDLTAAFEEARRLFEADQLRKKIESERHEVVTECNESVTKSNGVMAESNDVVSTCEKQQEGNHKENDPADPTCGLSDEDLPAGFADLPDNDLPAEFQNVFTVEEKWVRIEVCANPGQMATLGEWLGRNNIKWRQL